MYLILLSTIFSIVSGSANAASVAENKLELFETILDSKKIPDTHKIAQIRPILTYASDRVNELPEAAQPYARRGLQEAVVLVNRKNIPGLKALFQKNRLWIQSLL